jgi:hypothetical protein
MNALSRWGRNAALAIGLFVAVFCGFSDDGMHRRAEAAQAGAKNLPKYILIIRHAEKPAKEDGDVHLSAVGKERAQKLHLLFMKSDKRPDPFPVPDFIFATHNGENSHRPVETVTPLSLKLKLAINEEYHNALLAVVKKGKTAKGINNMRDEILGSPKYAGKTVLIAWHHGKIPEVAHVLKATQAPAKWDGSEVFDRVWQISYDGQGAATFVDRPQNLLPGDSEK